MIYKKETQQSPTVFVSWFGPLSGLKPLFIKGKAGAVVADVFVVIGFRKGCDCDCCCYCDCFCIVIVVVFVAIASHSNE